MTRIFTKTLRLIVCLAAGTLIIPAAEAQTNGGPDTYGYVWRDSNDPNGPAYSWVDITSQPGATQVTGLADDNVRGPYTIGFPFHYYWYDVTTFKVGSNGYLAFGLLAAAHPFPIIPSTAGIQNFVAGMMSDLTFTDAAGAMIPTASAWYWTSPGNDSLVVSYIDVPFWDPVAPGYIGSNSFQIILSNVDSSITFNYLAQNGIYNNPTNFCSIGIENVSGTIGLQHSHDVLPPAIYSIKFYYPSNNTFQVNDASIVSINNESTGGLFLSANGAPYTMSAEVKNTGNQPLASFNVLSRVVNFLNQNQAMDNLGTSALAPGASETLVFTNTFTPTTAGTFRQITNTQLVGDATPSNNLKELELQVVDTTSVSIQLSFDSGIDAGLGGLGWQGGGGGAGVHFIPPFTPSKITQLSAFIAGNVNLTGFAMLILDDDGPGGTPMTVLDSIWVPSASVITGTWNIVPVINNVTISSGGFYVAWMMGGDGISLGQNQVTPISNRTYEVLGQASNPTAWAEYRYREIEDLMINAFIEIPLGVSENENSGYLGEFYPNPASDMTRIDYKFPNTVNELTWNLYDVNGKLVSAGSAPGSETGTLTITTSQLENGVYFCAISNGAETYHKKLTLVK